jgi:mono/diheme cytochrome c family protein
MRQITMLLLLALAVSACAHHGSSPSAAASDGRGAQLFAENCQACHGERGAGGPVGKALIGERNRKDLHDVIAVIDNPDPLMPKLYPGTLTKRDVDEIAAYVESL